MRNLIKFIFVKKGVDKGIYLCVILLSVFGIIMIGDASVGMVVKYGNQYPIMNMAKQAVFLIAGAFVMVISANRFKTSKLTERIVWFLYIIVLISMGVCRLWNINGSYAWIKIGPFTLQPAEFMKLALILLLGFTLGTLPKKYTYYSGTRKLKEYLDKQKINHCVLYPVLAILLAFLVCAFYQKDLGSALILLGISGIIFLANPNPKLTRLKILAVVLFIALILILSLFGNVLLSHQVSRIESWLNPLKSENVYNSSYQIVNGLIAIANGGLIGLGFGNSVMKYGYIPESQNDYISAIIIEEFGLLGFAIMLIPYLYIIFKLYRYALKIKNPTDKMILIGVSSYFVLHLFINIGGVSGLIPMTGVPLLLVSAGGSSVLSSMTGIGIAQSIIKRYNRQQLKEKAENELSAD